MIVMEEFPMKPAVDLRACRPTADMHPAVDALPYYDADTNSIRCCTGVAEAADGSRHVSVSTDLFVQPGDQCYERVADGFVFIKSLGGDPRL
jgi:hypothetical protein